MHSADVLTSCSFGGMVKLRLDLQKQCILAIPSLITLFKNLPDSGRHVTSPYQGLFPADRRERRKEPGYEVVVLGARIVLNFLSYLVNEHQQQVCLPGGEQLFDFLLAKTTSCNKY